MKKFVIGALTGMLSVSAFAEKTRQQNAKLQEQTINKQTVTKISKITSQPLKLSDKKVSSTVKAIKISKKLKNSFR